MSTLPASLKRLLVSKVHTTWAKTFVCKPQYYFQPTNLTEIEEIVNYARKFKKSIMVVGSGHSPSDMTMTNDWLVNLDKFNKILKESPSKDGKYTDITTESGIRIFQLNEVLSSKGLAIQNLGSISDQSIAGIISTGTHGSSQYHGLVSQQIVDLTLINGMGELINCSATKNPKLFKAALLSLGKIGIIVEVTIRTIPRYQIKSKQEVITFETLLEKFDSIWTTDEFIRIWWFPYTKRCILWRASKTVEPISKPRLSWYGTNFGRFFYESLLWISVKFLPSLTPFIERFVFSRQYGLTETFDNGEICIQESVEGLNMDCLFSQYVDEWAAPLINGPEIIRSLNKSIEEAASSKEFFVHSPIEIRCSNTTTPKQPQDLSIRKLIDNGPVYGNQLRPYLDTTPQLNWVPNDHITNSQLTLYINATIYRPFYCTSPYKKWFKIFEETMDAAGGKPHWAKNFLCDKNKMLEWYGDDLIEWRKIRKESDPEGVFLSGIDWVKRFGIVEDDEIERVEKNRFDAEVE